MEKSPEKTKFRARLLIDQKKHRVILAEVCRDFVDVLFSLLTLPMGTIIRLLEKHKKSQTVGCFNNIYKSVSDMVVDDFETEACKSMLLYPRSTKEIHYRRLKLNIDDTEDAKFFTCPLYYRISCRQYTNFNTSKCSCGELMIRQIEVSEEEQLGGPIGNDEDGVFVSCRSSYIVTDDLKVTLSSLGVISNVLNGLGYAGFDDLQEVLVDIGFEEVLALLGNFFATEYPLTRTFLKKFVVVTPKKRLFTRGPKVEHVKGGHECNVKLFIRKIDRKILYAECSEDFIDSLLTFLALPLELAWSLSNDSSILGCVGNLCKSQCRGALSSPSWEIPYHYTCGEQVLDIPPQPPVVYECVHSLSSLNLVRKVVNRKMVPSRMIIKMSPRDPKIKTGTPPTYGTGFVKRDTKFIVSDDLVITPMRSSSTINLFKNSVVSIGDLEEQTISISKPELISILRASFISRSALTNGLSNMVRKKQVLGTV
ncbi:hypothetical protein ISN44_As08g009350 [Arabidopsis suecica]|uniref:DUF674 family protein n=1 Tax=Arabidopsis suecica TaxID=45249 RepID=A0A8T2B374_ARASU|nr:hypothetical protein ISN44_As08g009350 [Arabidopsis suecica]